MRGVGRDGRRIGEAQGPGRLTVSPPGLPAQVMAGEYAAVLRRLRVGGRWVQVAPSKSRYSQLNAPSFRELAVLYDR